MFLPSLRAADRTFEEIILFCKDSNLKAIFFCCLFFKLRLCLSWDCVACLLYIRQLRQIFALFTNSKNILGIFHFYLYRIQHVGVAVENLFT